MRRNLQTKRGRGFRKSLLRGLEKGNREWLRICTGHNLLRSGAPRDGKRAASSTKDAYFVRSHAYGPDTDAGLRVQLTAITVSAVRSWPKPHLLAIPLTGC